MMWGARQDPSRRWLLDRHDYGWILALMAIGLGLRLLYFSGFGLADDAIFRGSIAQIQSQRLIWGNMTYRVTWWLPTVLSCRFLGLTELGLILPITITATLGIALIYAFGKALWGTPGAIIAALLLITQPLDFAWSTMLANDIMVSFTSALTVLLVLRALAQEDATWKCRLWIIAGVSLWTTFLAKVSALSIIPAIGAICWMNRLRLGSSFVDFLTTVGFLFGVTSLVLWIFTDDPLAPYHAEFMGHPLSADTFWIYPRWLFLRDHMGDFVYSWYPHLLVFFMLSSRWLAIRTSPEIFWWFACVFVALNFNVKRADGAWFTAFRNIRHGHVLIYPLILLLTGYLVGLRSKYPKLCHGLLGMLLLFSLWQSTATASKTKVAFADRREACRFLATLPPKPIYADVPLIQSCLVLEGVPWKFEAVQEEPQLAAGTSGYLVTGGSREPIYGAPAAPRADALTPGKWKLLREVPGPAQPSPWRPEPLRVWEAIESAAQP
jgi:hypothetical protein